jgi:hypothetical protein
MQECDWRGMFGLGFMLGGILAVWIDIFLQIINNKKQE